MKPYKSYKNIEVDWIGNIPNEWKLTKIKYAGDYVNGFAFKPSHWGDSGKLIIRIQNLTKGNASENFYDGNIDDKYIVKKGDLLFSWSTTLGLFEWNREDGLLNQHIFKVVLNSIYQKKYYSYLFSPIINYLNSQSHGSAMTHLTKDSFGKVLLPLPSIFEQKKISDYLDYKTLMVNKIIKASEKKIQLLEEQKITLINSAVTKGLNPNIDLKNTDTDWIGKIPQKWRLIRLKYLFAPREEKTLSGEEELLTVTITNGIVRRRDFVKKGEHLSRSDSLIGYKVCYENDLVNNIMKMGFRCTGISKFNGIVSPAYSVFSLIKKENVPAYWNYLLRTDLYVAEYKKRSKGIQESRMRLYDDYFLDIYSIVPPIFEQHKIVEYLDNKISNIDNLINKERKRIELTNEYHKSLISEVVTGKIDVRNEVFT
jgi:type I restriction enzyme, S subunit